MHPIFTFPAAYVIDTMGTRAGIMLGSVLCIFGISLRLLVNSGFWLVIVGQVLAGIGRPFIMNCQAKISCNWFYASNRVFYTFDIGSRNPTPNTRRQRFTHYRYGYPWCYVRKLSHNYQRYWGRKTTDVPIDARLGNNGLYLSAAKHPLPVRKTTNSTFRVRRHGSVVI